MLEKVMIDFELNGEILSQTYRVEVTNDYFQNISTSDPIHESIDLQSATNITSYTDDRQQQWFQWNPNDAMKRKTVHFTFKSDFRAPGKQILTLEVQPTNNYNDSIVGTGYRRDGDKFILIDQAVVDQVQKIQNKWRLRQFKANQLDTLVTQRSRMQALRDVLDTRNVPQTMDSGPIGSILQFAGLPAYRQTELGGGRRRSRKANSKSRTQRSKLRIKPSRKMRL